MSESIQISKQARSVKDCMYLFWRRDGVVGIVTGLWSACSGVQFTPGTRDFPLLHSVQTGSGAYPAWVDPGVFLLRSKSNQGVKLIHLRSAR